MRGAIIVVLLLVVGAFALGVHCGQAAAGQGAESTDTVVIRDTVRIDAPPATDSVVVRYVVRRLPAIRDTVRVVVRDTVVRVDSVEVALPIEWREYRSADYRAYVSGYEARLDSIEVYRQTITTRERTRATRWSLGLQVGYGATRHGFGPYVGVGVSHRFTFGR